MNKGPVVRIKPLGFPWHTSDPFLFCAHHDDTYPAGNERMGPASSLVGRNIGQDFEGKDGWRMYHGDVVPGFPQHPHRGFETVTIVRRGLIDHSDSLGATARFGHGDVQWLTAGKGIVHSEMFPLLDEKNENPADVFQIWLNLPRADKMVEPHFAMLWSDAVPRRRITAKDGTSTELTIVAGRYADAAAPSPPPHSWAARPDSDVAIWTMKMSPGATFTLPPAAPGSNRTLYFFRGTSLRIFAEEIPPNHGVELRGESKVVLSVDQRASSETELLLLQGKPIAEPVVQYGPFVMNTRTEIQQAMSDYRRTRFGGWPWPSDGPVHPRNQGRFARRKDGPIEVP